MSELDLGLCATGSASAHAILARPFETLAEPVALLNSKSDKALAVPGMVDPTAEFQKLIGQEVVVDVVSQYVYVGMLVGSDDKYLALAHADVHDLRDTATTRELYVLESRRHGIRDNRERVLVRMAEIVSLSALADVIK